jgi:hypothetical protein
LPSATLAHDCGAGGLTRKSAQHRARPPGLAPPEQTPRTPFSGSSPSISQAPRTPGTTLVVNPSLRRGKP